MVIVYGVVAADVQQEELSFLQDVSASLLGQCITRAASDLNTELRAMRVNPSQVTEAAYPDDYEWCRSTVIFGAAGMYLRTVSGYEQSATVKLQTFMSRIERFRDRPQLLQAYSNLASTTNTARSHATFGDRVDAAARTRSRLLDPSRLDRWRQ